MKRNYHLNIGVLIIASLLQNVCYGIDSIEYQQRSSLFAVTDQTVPIVTASYIGWGEGWKWAGPKISQDPIDKTNKPANFFYAGTVPSLDMDFTTAVSQKDGQLSWVYDWNKKTDYPAAIGFGVGFKFNLESPSFGSTVTEPELLPDNQGWKWQMPSGDAMEVKFSPALAHITFGGKKKNRIRAFFFNAIKKGNEKITMTITFSGKKPQILGFSADSFAKENTTGWHKDILSPSVSPIDLSFLNANDMPAGKHGFVKAQADQMVFEDGTPIKFWGTNIMAYALYKSSDEEIKKHAKRIAQLGFNLARIHHHDSNWVKPNIFENPSDNTQAFSKESLRKLDWWIKCLKEQGVYVWLDLHVGRTFTANDGINDFEDIAGAKTKKNKRKKNQNTIQVKGFNYFNESVQTQMQRFNEAYLSHVNQYTKLAYKDDPAVLALLITNENDLTHHFGNLLLKKTGVPKHNALLTEDIKKFSTGTGLAEKQINRIWESGEPKIYLSDVEHRFNQKMIEHLRGLGAKSMIATTNSWGFMGLAGLPSLTDGNLVDVHSYGKPEEIYYNPRFNPGFLTWIGAAQVTGKPLAVSEWNLGTFPVADRYMTPLFTASIADLQGWDAMMLYGYSQAPLVDEPDAHSSNWTSYNDPSLMGIMPAAALMFRQNHVSFAKQTYEIKLSREDFFYKKISPITSKALRTLLETSRFTVSPPDTKELPWLEKNKIPSKASQVVTDANLDFIPEKFNFVQSDTGELKRDWEKGIHTINTAKSQVATGEIGKEAINLQDVAFKMKTPKAVVAVQSLENKPIAQSKAIFITAIAKSSPSEGNYLPYFSEPVTGEISIKAPPGLSLFPINRLGEKGGAIKPAYSNGQYQIKLGDKNESHWFILTN